MRSWAFSHKKLIIINYKLLIKSLPETVGFFCNNSHGAYLRQGFLNPDKNDNITSP